MNMPIANARTHVQNHRIDNGAQSGELTRKETHGLRQDQREIKTAIQEAKSDGEVTKAERKEIRGLQNDASKDIFESKHDDQKRGTPRANARQEKQHERIQNGVEDGSLTKGEAFGVRAAQGAVRRFEAKAKADGEVSPEERAKLEQLQDYASKQIYAAKHNGSTRA